VHIGDPIGVAYGGATWRVMFEKIIGLLSSVQVCPLLILWQRMTFGSGYLENGASLSKSPGKDKSVGCPLGDGKCVGIAEHFP